MEPFGGLLLIHLGEYYFVPKLYYERCIHIVQVTKIGKMAKASAGSFYRDGDSEGKCIFCGAKMSMNRIKEHIDFNVGEFLKCLYTP